MGRSPALVDEPRVEFRGRPVGTVDPQTLLDEFGTQKQAQVRAMVGDAHSRARPRFMAHDVCDL